MYCFNCGTKLPDNANFCPACGQKINTHINKRELTGQIQDAVSLKAEEVTFEEESHILENDINSKAEFLGFETANTNTPSKKSIKHKNTSSDIKIEKETFLVNYLFRLKKTDGITCTYSLFNSKTNKQSDWFDVINYAGNDVFYIERDKSIGYLESDLTTYQLWDHIHKISIGLIAVSPQSGHWKLVTTGSKHIKINSEYDFSGISSCGEFIFGWKNNKNYVLSYNKDKDSFTIYPDIIFSTIISKDHQTFESINTIVLTVKSDKYGFIFIDTQNNKLQFTKCIFDGVDSFKKNSSYTNLVASVIYQGEKCILSQTGVLYGQGKSKNKDLTDLRIISGVGAFIIAFGITIVTKWMISRGSLSNTYNSAIEMTDCIIFIIFGIIAYAIIYQYQYNISKYNIIKIMNVFL